MKLLFICTHNRCRSILAEAVTNYYGKGIFEARSAGSQPAGEVHPLSLKHLSALNIPTAGLCSQSWDEHESWQPDVVITVCDSAAGEACPVWFGDSLKVHWGLSDPSVIEGNDNETAEAFESLIKKLKLRIEKLLEVNIHRKSKEDLPNVFKTVGNL